jgi:hypothetical protein
MKIETKIKYAAVTPDGKFPSMFSEADIYVRKVLAEKNLQATIAMYKRQEKDALHYLERIPQDADYYLNSLEIIKAKIQELESCKIEKIEISFTVVA